MQRLIDGDARLEADRIHLRIGILPARRGRTIEPNVLQGSDQETRNALADLVRKSHRKLVELNASPLYTDRHSAMRGPNNEWSRLRVAAALLAPDIQKALLQGSAPVGLDPAMLLSRDIPLDWDRQRKFFGL